MLAMFIAISDERMQPTDDTQFTFMETAPGYPVPIKEWFYPGRLTGLEFLYSKEQRETIAQHMHAEATTQTAANIPEESPSVSEPAPQPSVEQPAQPQAEEQPQS